MLHVLSVAGARPNFVKIAALHEAFSESPGIASRILHTGQHYDVAMSDVFFQDLELPAPDVFLGIGSGSHAEQTAKIMIAFEQELLRSRPDAVVLVGDVNSTLACAIVCAKMQIPVAHVEAGLRSRDREMPEEINRIVTDVLSDFLFVTERSGLENLKAEGVPPEKVHFVGNVMIDSLVRYREKAETLKTFEKIGVPDGRYVLMTMHRPATVDDPERLQIVIDLIEQLQDTTPVVFPVHPRTRKQIEDQGLLHRIEAMSNVSFTPPIGYLDFLNVMSHAGVLITDSGGVQEETTYLGIPCITVRPNTERPVTVELGTNILLPLQLETILDHSRRALEGRWKAGEIPPHWDGRAAYRIGDILEQRVPVDGRIKHPDAAKSTERMMPVVQD